MEKDKLILFKKKGQYDVCTNCGKRKLLRADLWISEKDKNIPVICGNCSKNVVSRLTID